MAMAEVEDFAIDLEADPLARAVTAYQDPLDPSNPGRSLPQS
jgi:hypothetical protein